MSACSSPLPPRPARRPAISVRGLRVTYGDVEAVRGIDLDVRTGEILALLGPNGAGKTSTVEVLEGFRAATAGEVSVLGADPRRAPRAWRERLGIVLQESSPELGPDRARVPAPLRRLLHARPAASTRRSPWSGSRSARTTRPPSSPAASGAGSTSRSR